MKIIDGNTIRLDLRRHKGPTKLYPYADEELARKERFPYSYIPPKHVEVSDGDYYTAVAVVGSLLGHTEWVILGCRPATEEEIQSAKEQQTEESPGAKVKSPWWSKLKNFFRRGSK